MSAAQEVRADLHGTSAANRASIEERGRRPRLTPLLPSRILASATKWAVSATRALGSFVGAQARVSDEFLASYVADLALPSQSATGEKGVALIALMGHLWHPT